jgi:hypothetical protein
MPNSILKTILKGYDDRTLYETLEQLKYLTRISGHELRNYLMIDNLFNK